MDATDLTEYNAFGPWVDEVRTATEVPRLYRDYPLDFERTEMVLKVPRNIARRDANPSMDLYDALIIVDDRHTVLLSRDGSSYTTRSVMHDSLVAIADSVVLLDGRFVVHVSDGDPLSIAYNGSDQASMRRLADRLRQLALRSRADSDTTSVSPQSGYDVTVLRGDQDYGVIGAWLELAAREPGVAAAGAHSSIDLVPRSGFLARLLHRFRPMALRGAIVGVSDREIHIIHRREVMVRGADGDPSNAHTVILRHTGAAVEAGPHPYYAGAQVIRVTKGQAVIEFVFPEPSPTATELTSALRPTGA